MDLGILSIGSSSSGNSYLIRSKSTDIVLDVGLAARTILHALESSGVKPDTVRSILVTHEHVDHVKSLRAVAKACRNASVISTKGTMEACDRFEYVEADRLRRIAAQDEFAVGDIGVKAFSLSHDAAEPVSYSFTCGETKLVVVTDTGTVTDEIFDEMKDADLLVLEANHEVSVLQMGPYPYPLKRRILSDHGHLSNIAAGESMIRMLEHRIDTGRAGVPTAARGGMVNARPRVMLAHLSTTNNTPETAGLTVRNLLEEQEFYRGIDYDLGIAAKSDPTGFLY